jgi:SAM-dependent methyltransferase
MSNSDTWSSGAAYEAYVGRWSRPIARQFFEWLAVPPHSRWLDVGCGTGALTELILAEEQPEAVTGVEPSEAFIAHAREQIRDPRVRFLNANAMDLPLDDAEFDAVVSGLVLNFIPEPEVAMAEMVRVARGGGTVASYVWDYGEGMQLMRYFWDAAVDLDPSIAEKNEAFKFALRRPEPLRQLFQNVGLEDIEVRAIDTPTHFRDFDDYWSPFLGGVGPAPQYATSLPDDKRTELREHLRSTLPTAPDGSISLTARAWAVRGRVMRDA